MHHSRIILSRPSRRPHPCGPRAGRCPWHIARRRARSRQGLGGQERAVQPDALGDARRHAAPDKTHARGQRAPEAGLPHRLLGLRLDVPRAQELQGAPLSLTTRSLSPSMVTTITKYALLPGDVILKRGSHVLLFVRWVDSARQSVQARTRSAGTDYGCVQTTRNVLRMSKWGYYAYRYKKIDDFYPDYLESIYGLTDYDTAVAASRVSFPPTSTPTVAALVITNSRRGPGNLAGAALAGAAEARCC